MTCAPFSVLNTKLLIKLKVVAVMYIIACVCVCSHCLEHPWRLRSESFVPGKKSIFALTPKHDEAAEQQCAVDDNDDDADDDYGDDADDDGGSRGDDNDDAVDLTVTVTGDSHDSQFAESVSAEAAVLVHSHAAHHDTNCANETSHET